MADFAWTADELLESLIRFPSVSDISNADVSQWVAERLTELGFDVERVAYQDAAGVDKVNILGRRGPAASGGLAYFAHTDVVPADPWRGPIEGAADAQPFAPVRHQQRIYGRGSCDMKGSLACMLAAASRINAEDQSRPLTIVSTADEEVGFEGARTVVQRSQMYRQLVAEQPISIIGEPTEMRVVHAHKGIAGYSFTSHGRAAHSSSREGRNANLAIVPMLVELKRLYELSEADPSLQHPAFDPPTLTWNFGVSDQATAVNITPATSRAWVCYRPMPGIDCQPLETAMLACAESLGLTVTPFAGGPPLWVDPDSDCIRQVLRWAGREQAETVCYGTDGGQFGELQQLVVIGPGDIAQAHTDDEWISESQLRAGTDIYETAIRDRCC